MKDKVATIRNAGGFQDHLVAILENCANDPDLDAYEEFEGARINSFENTGLLTRDKGVLVRLNNGAEFQVTIICSQRPTEKNDDDGDVCPSCDGTEFKWGTKVCQECGYDMAGDDETED